MTKDVLVQYKDMLEEVKEIREKISKLETTIFDIETKIEHYEKSGETVKDKVYGGMGGIQGYVIEGFPSRDYGKARSNLMMKKLLLNQRKSTLEILEVELTEKTNEVEEFIASIDDSRIRRIINMRFMENLSWDKIAARMGHLYTADNVRMTFNRFLEKT